jgi:hypothetical protein
MNSPPAVLIGPIANLPYWRARFSQAIINILKELDRIEKHGERLGDPLDED